MKKVLILLVVLISFSRGFAQNLNEEEQKLYRFIMAYRKQKKLPAISLSKSLTIVAQTHCKDLAENAPREGNCNLHSWSALGKWTPCCYTPDHAQANCMWEKPKELTKYSGNGYEIAFWHSEKATAESALKGWKSSNGHNAMILNLGKWNEKWNAIGIGIYKGYATAWFGNEADSE